MGSLRRTGWGICIGTAVAAIDEEPYPESRTSLGPDWKASSPRAPLVLSRRDLRTAFFTPVTNPPTNLFLGESAMTDLFSESPASDDPAVARNGTPGSTLNAPAPFAPYRFSGGGGAGDRSWSWGRCFQGFSFDLEDGVLLLPSAETGRAGDSESHLGEGTKALRRSYWV